ncbi:hypothetical protein KIPB_010397, partial [Kipferlia bialata]|eukprot:g10397.t1
MDPSSKGFQICLLIVLCLMLFGNYWNYDTPTGIESQLEADFDITKEQYLALYAVYNYPSIIMPFVFGMLGDRIGPAPAAAISAGVNFSRYILTHTHTHTHIYIYIYIYIY